MYKGKTVGVIVPAYNEESFILAVVRRIPEYADRIYVIDDGSIDSTYKIASDFALTSSKPIKVIKHRRNCGVGKAITTGYRQCLNDGVDIAVVMAGDNQMDPDNLPRLLDPIVENKADYAIGDRLSKVENTKGMTNYRRFGNRLLCRLTKIAAGNPGIKDPQNGYAALTRDYLNRLNLDGIYPGYGYCNDMLIKLSAYGARIVFVEMPAVYGNEKSKIRIWKYIPTLSGILLRGYLWRVGRKYLKRGNTC